MSVLGKIRTWQPYVSFYLDIGEERDAGVWILYWSMKFRNHRSSVWDYVCCSLTSDSANSCPKSSHAYSFSFGFIFYFHEEMCMNKWHCDLCFTISIFITVSFSYLLQIYFVSEGHKLLSSPEIWGAYAPLYCHSMTV